MTMILTMLALLAKVEEINKLTARARPPWTEMKRTPKKAVIITTKSNLSIFQMLQAAGRSMRPITAVTMIAPSTTLGVY